MTKKVLPVLVVALIAIGAWLAYTQFVRVEPLPEGLIQSNGRIEGDTVTVSSKYAGRIAEIFFEEGYAVHSGDIVATLEALEINAKVRQAEQAMEVVVHEREAARRQSEQAQRDATRFQALFADGTATAHEAEQAMLAYEVALEQLTGITAKLKRAVAAFDETTIVRDDLTLTAPADGIITNRLHEPGVVIAAGTPVVTIVNLDQLHLKVYIPEIQIGKLRRGLPARIYTDAFPETPYEATVGYIASRAEFTPKEVQTQDERVKLVYAVKLDVTANPDHQLTPGIPADAVIRWNESVAWSAPRW